VTKRSKSSNIVRIAAKQSTIKGRDALKAELLAAQQRLLDQETVIETFRRLLAAIIRKHGTLDVIHLDRREIEAVLNGALRVKELATGVALSIRIDGKGPLITPPRLVS
jgi:hypothetical protein